MAADDMIYLASKSPRRQELLNQIAVRFRLLEVPAQDTVHADMIDETVRPGENALDYVSRLASEKARYAWCFLVSTDKKRYPVLTADTTVTIDRQILGKPANRDEAFSMLSCLSGRTHQVLTAVAVIYDERLWQTVQISDVTFATLTPEQISAYTDTGEPYDKAGGYGIQGLAGKFISGIQGSYSGIMGLPLYETTVLLRKAGVLIP